MWRAVRIAIIVSACLAPGSVASAVAMFSGIGDLPGGLFVSRSLGVSGDGQVVVGESRTNQGDQAFRWTVDGGFELLGDLPGGSVGGVAWAANQDGSVIVGQGLSASQEAFRWTETGGIQGLGPGPSGSFPTRAFGVSDDGSVIVGDQIALSSAQAWMWTADEGMLGLGFLGGASPRSFAAAVSGDGSIVVGASIDSSDTQAFRWTAESGMLGLGFLEGGENRSIARRISSDGTVIVGQASITDPTGQGTSANVAFRWTIDEGMVALGDLPGGRFDGSAWGVSGDGSVVVGCSDTAATESTCDTAFIWDTADGMRSLKEELENVYGLDLTGWTLFQADSISDDGLTIVGRGLNPDGFNEGWITVIPEPSTALLLATGLVAMAVGQRRRV